jgi:serine protease Do
VVVSDVDPNGIASKRGITAGDVILDVSGKTVSQPSDVREALGAARANHKTMALLRIRSGNQTHFVAVPVA